MLRGEGFDLQEYSLPEFVQVPRFESQDCVHEIILLLVDM